MEMSKTIGPYTIKDIFSPPDKTKTDLMVAYEVPYAISVNEADTMKGGRHGLTSKIIK